MEFMNIINCFKSLMDITDKQENKKDERIKIISECIVELSGISFLKLGQAIRNKNFKKIYEEILNINQQLTRCIIKTVPIIYRYGECCDFDAVRESKKLLNSNISFLEKYIPLKDDVMVNANDSLYKCANECWDILIYLKEQLYKCDDNIYMMLIACA